jgi:hypothetical protein
MSGAAVGKQPTLPDGGLPYLFVPSTEGVGLCQAAQQSQAGQIIPSINQSYSVSPLLGNCFTLSVAAADGGCSTGMTANVVMTKQVTSCPTGFESCVSQPGTVNGIWSGQAFPCCSIGATCCATNIACCGDYACDGECPGQ